MNCEKCGRKMLEGRFGGKRPAAYEGAKCINLKCPKRHKWIEIDQTHKPKCSVTKLHAQKAP